MSNNPDDGIVKPGIKSTEFWLALVVIIGAIVLCAIGKVDLSGLTTVLGLATAGYSASRGIAKLNKK